MIAILRRSRPYASAQTGRNSIPILEGIELKGKLAMSQAFKQSRITRLFPSAHGINNRIALYVDSRSLTATLQKTLLQAGFVTVDLKSLDELVNHDEENFPVAIIVDLDRCRRDACAKEVFTQLQRRFVPPRHLFCIASSDDISARLEAVRLGATRFLSKPVDMCNLIKVLNGVTGQTQTQPFKALLIENDEIVGNNHARALNDAGVETLLIRDPLQAPDLIKRLNPDIIVCDACLSGCTGIELLAILRQDDVLADTPIIILSSEKDSPCQMDALYFGGDDFLDKLTDTQLLVATVIARAKRTRMVKRSRSEYRSIVEQLRDMEDSHPKSVSKARKSARPLVENSPGQIASGERSDASNYGIAGIA